MANVQLDINNTINRITLKAMLESDGHRIVESEPDVLVCDDVQLAVGHVEKSPTLVLATAAEIKSAVNAMRKGVFGYIFLPFQPGEASMMIERALNTGHNVSAYAASDFEFSTLEEIETQHILTTLRHCKNNQAKAARLLGIGRNTLWRKLNRIKESK